MVSIAEMSERAIITCIKTVGSNKKKSKLQTEQTEWLEMGGIRIKRIKQAEKLFQGVLEGKYIKKSIK